jgi:hypothetical protein
MSDIRDQIAARYTALQGRSQILVLAKLADRLTLLARDTYDGQVGVTDGARLRAFNEAQNRVVAHLVRLLTGDEHRYPDDVFANVLVDQFDILQLDPDEILRMLDRARDDRGTSTIRLAEAGND